MIYVGIDVAKLNHFASLISSDGEILVGPFQFSNDGDGFQYLVSAFEPFDDEEIIIGLESTAHYADNLIRYLVAEGYNVCVLNPLSTSSIKYILLLSTILHLQIHKIIANYTHCFLQLQQ